MEFLRKKGVELIPHPPYSPDLAPNDFFLYDNAEKKLERVAFFVYK